MDFEFDESIFKRTHLKTGLILLGIAVALMSIACAVIFIFREQFFMGPSSVTSEYTNYLVGIGLAFPAGLVLVITGLTLFFKGLAGKSNINRFLNEYGADRALSEIQKPIYVLAHKKKVISVITKDFIFDVGHGFIKTASIDYCYGYNYKGNTSIRAYDLNNKAEYFASGIYLNSQESAAVFKAIASVNPFVLCGYTGNNANAHMERVRDYRAAKAEGREFRIKKYEVIYHGCEEENKQQVIKAMKSSTNLGMKEIEKAASSSNVTIAICTSTVVADGIVKKLKKAGADAEYREI